MLQQRRRSCWRWQEAARKVECNECEDRAQTTVKTTTRAVIDGLAPHAHRTCSLPSQPTPPRAKSGTGFQPWRPGELGQQRRLGQQRAAGQRSEAGEGV